MKRNVQILLLIIGLSSISCDELSISDAPVIDTSNIYGPQRSPRAILGGGGGKETVGGGRLGEDFPVLNSVPWTDFNCSGLLPGYYADESTGCQVFHTCHSDSLKDSFLCPNGKMFHQLGLICDWWYNVDCKGSQVHQKVNADIGKSDRSGSIVKVVSPGISSKEFSGGIVLAKNPNDITSPPFNHRNNPAANQLPNVLFTYNKLPSFQSKNNFRKNTVRLSKTLGVSLGQVAFPPQAFKLQTQNSQVRRGPVVDVKRPLPPSPPIEITTRRPELK